jgi:hypothetical protein
LWRLSAAVRLPFEAAAGDALDVISLSDDEAIKTGMLAITPPAMMTV